MEDCYKSDIGALGCVEPEIAILSGQTIEEVNRLLEKEKASDNSFAELFEDHSSSTEKIRLSFEDELTGCGLEYHELPERPLIKDLPEFATWRRLSGISQEKEANVSWEPTQDLMDILLVKLKRRFPKMSFDWSVESEWRYCLLIEGKVTKINAIYLGNALAGLSNLINPAQAQAIIIRLVVNKIEEIFA